MPLRFIKKYWKKILTIIASFIGFLILMSYLLLMYWEPIISKAIKDSLYSSTNKLYRIEFEDITFNVFMGNFGLKNIRLTPDKGVYEELKQKKEQPAYLFELDIERAKVHGINIWELYQNKALDIMEISINKPKVRVLNDLSYKKAADDTSLYRNPYNLIKDQLSMLKIEQINLKNIEFEFIADSVGKRKSKSIFLSYFKVRNLIIDSLAQVDTTRPFYSDDIKLSIKNFSHQFRDSVNTMQFEEVVASTATSSIQVYNFKIIPNKNEEQFADKAGFRKTRIYLYVKEANFQRVNFKKLFFEQKLYGKVVEVNKLESNIFRNNTIPKNLKKKIRFPAELVYDIRIPFYFDQLNLKNSKLDYGEIDSKTKHRWKIDFTDIKGSFSHFSNDTAALIKNPFTTINLNTSINHKAKTNVEFIFDCLHTMKSFFVKGTVSNYNLQDMSPILSQLVHMEITNCHLRSLKFMLSGDKKSMNCNVSMMYNNLRVKILEFDKVEKKLKRHGLYTILANHMVLEDANPRLNGRMVRPKFVLNRKEEWSFFSFIWRGVLKGMKESVGLSERMEAELKYQSDRYFDFKKFRSELKENRKARKEERRRRRLEKSANADTLSKTYYK